MRGSGVDRVGEIHNDLQITVELGEGKVMAKCIKCGEVREYYKKTVLDTGRCKVCSPYSKDIINTTIDDFYIKSRGDTRYTVRAVCLKCNVEDTYSKQSIIKHTARCKHCWEGWIIGKVYNGLKVIEDKGHNKALAECIVCGDIQEYSKTNLIQLCTSCRNCKAIKDSNKTINNFKILGKTADGLIKTECLKCGKIHSYKAQSLYNAICKNCGIIIGNPHYNKKIEGHRIKNVTVLRYEYIGRDNKPYYSCLCNKCNEELMLNYDEIFTYRCTKE